MLLVRPTLPALRHGRTRPRRLLRALAATGILTSALLSPSYGQEPARQYADAASGQLEFNNACRTCHTAKQGDNRLGPHLHNIIGRKAGSLQNYGYSAAMKGAEFVWNEEKLERFIANPDAVVPGNNMKPYGGLASAEERTRIVSFLRSVGSGQ